MLLPGIYCQRYVRGKSKENAVSAKEREKPNSIQIFFYLPFPDLSQIEICDPLRAIKLTNQIRERWIDDTFARFVQILS